MKHKLRFDQIRVGDWFTTHDDKLCVKLRQLNSSNAFNFTDCDYAYIYNNQQVFLAVKPRHMQTDKAIHDAKQGLLAVIKILQSA